MRTLRLLLAILVVAAALGAFTATVPAPLGVPLEKVAYFHNATQDLGAGPVRIMDTVQGTSADQAEDVFTDPSRALSWFLAPRLAGPMDVGGDVSLRVWVLLNSGGGEGTTFIDLTLNVYRIDSTGARAGGALATGSVNVQITTHYSEYFVSGTLAAQTLPAGDSLEAELSVGSSNSATKQVAWGSDRFPSRLSFTTTTYLNIEDAGAENAAGARPASFTVDEDIHLVANVSDRFGGYDVHWVNLTVVAPDGTYVYLRAPMALVAGGPTSLFKGFELVYTGPGKLRGTYTATVEAVDNTGYYYRFPDRPGDLTFGGHRESWTFTFVIGQPVWAYFQVFDDLNLTVPGATVEVWEGLFRRAVNVTDASGLANLTDVPGTGVYSVRVEWAGVQVYSAPANIPGNVTAASAIPLRAAIYHLAVEVVDVAFAPIGGAAVFLTYPNGTNTLLPFITDPVGRATVGRVPVGPHQFRVVWLGAEVHRSSTVVSASGTIRLGAAVFYVDFTAVDSASLPVENVAVLVTDTVRDLVVESVSTNAAGAATARLPAGAYTWEAWWSGASVAGPTALDLTGNRTGAAGIPMRLDIFYVDVQVLDAENRTVLAAFVALTSASYSISGITDAQGFVRDLRVPAGPFTLIASWDGVEVYRAPVAVIGNDTFTAVASIYDLTIVTKDSGLAALPGVFVTVRRGDTTVASAVTNASGEAVFRLPAAEYTVTARLVTTYLLTPVDQSTNITVDLDAAKVEIVVFNTFPIALYTTALFALINVVLILLLILFFLYRRRKKRLAENFDDRVDELDASEEGRKASSEPPPASPGPEGAPGVPPWGAAPASGTSPEDMIEGEAPPRPETAAPPGMPPAPLLTGISNGAPRCGVCHGRIKEGMSLLRCSHCGAEYHEPCSSRLNECATCGLGIVPAAE